MKDYRSMLNIIGKLEEINLELTIEMRLGNVKKSNTYDWHFKYKIKF